MKISSITTSPLLQNSQNSPCPSIINFISSKSHTVFIYLVDDTLPRYTKIIHTSGEKNLPWSTSRDQHENEEGWRKKRRKKPLGSVTNVTLVPGENDNYLASNNEIRNTTSRLYRSTGSTRSYTRFFIVRHRTSRRQSRTRQYAHPISRISYCYAIKIILKRYASQYVVLV